MPNRPGADDRVADPWWRAGVLYQIYPRSFADGNGDGIGDLEGVIAHLDYLAWLGVDGIWLNPIMPSPNADWGYDVADYTGVDPDLGDLETLDRLVAEAGALGIRVLLDLVPNHTSDRHPWFVDSRSGRSSAHRDWYVWADPTPDGGPPNNWRSIFGGSAWTLDRRTGQYYLHNFLPEQPDLNWWSDDVRDAFDAILGFWLDRGVAGFRIDVAHGLVKDRELRDNPPVDEGDAAIIRAQGDLRPVYNMNRPEVHDVFRRWRALADGVDPPGVLIGETWVPDLPTLMRFYGDRDELHLALNVAFVFAEPGPEMRGVVEATEAALPPGAWPMWNGSNHDAGRFTTRWCEGDDRRIRVALVMLLTLRGTPLLYYGDEIGMCEVDVPPDRRRDPVGLNNASEEPGRDRARTPMPWTGDANGGFSDGRAEPWLPIGDATARNVAAERTDPGSTLNLCRDLIAVRRARADLHAGGYGPLEAPAAVWAFSRGDDTVVVLNLSDAGAVAAVGPGHIVIGTDRTRDGVAVGGDVALGPWEALVVART
jgi:alpha-glucosidase